MMMTREVLIASAVVGEAFDNHTSKHTLPTFDDGPLWLENQEHRTLPVTPHAAP